MQQGDAVQGTGSCFHAFSLTALLPGAQYPQSAPALDNTCSTHWNNSLQVNTELPGAHELAAGAQEPNRVIF